MKLPAQDVRGGSLTLMQRLPAADIERIFQAVENGFEAQIEFLCDLVRAQSLRGNEATVQDVVTRALVQRGYTIDQFSVDPLLVRQHPAFSPMNVAVSNVPNIVGVKKPKSASGRSLALNAHVDVVPSGNAKRWTHPPFVPTRKGDWLYGRGAGDMKAGLAANIFALDAVQSAGFMLRGPVQIQSVIEEEMTGNGSAMALAKGYVADAIIIPEPTDEQLVRANTGVIKFSLTVQGMPAHPREASSGKSAIEIATLLIEHLSKLEHEWISQRQSKPHFVDVENPIALTIGTLNGGEWIASIPSECCIEGRIGFYPGEEPLVRAREFEVFVADTFNHGSEFLGCPLPLIEWIGVMQAGYVLEPGSEAEHALLASHQMVRGKHDKLQSYVMPCYLDAALFANHGGIPALVYGPISERIHGIDERVNLPSLLRVTKTIALFAANWCGVEAS